MVMSRVGWLVLAAGLGSLVGGGVSAREPKGAATPEELFEKVQAAKKSGDMKAMLALAGGPHRAALEQAVELFKIGEAYEKALDDKFGKDPTYRSRFTPSSDEEKKSKAELKGKKDLGGDKVELTIWTTRREKVAVADPNQPGEKDVIVESKEIAIKEKSGWLLLVPLPFSATSSKMEKRKTADGKEIDVRVNGPFKEPTEKELAMMREILPKMRGILEQAAKDVAAGKYADRKVATNAVEKAMQAVVPKQSPPTEPPAKEPKKPDGKPGKPR